MENELDVSEMMSRQLPPDIMSLIRDVGALARDAGRRLFLVGGTVRDLFLGRANLDLDFVVENSVAELAGLLAARKKARVTLHQQFHTVKVGLGEYTFDIAVARSETYPRPGALPVVKPGIIAEDLSRRDFTINAMAVSLNQDDFGAVLDPHGGRNDLGAELLRILHGESFIDDPTRMFRALRYKSRLRFHLEQETARLLARDVGRIETVSGDRQRQELELVVEEERPEAVLLEGDRLGLLRGVLPALRFDSWLAERFQEVRSAPARGAVPLLYWSLLAYALAPEDCRELVARLKLPRRVAVVMTQVQQLKPHAEKLSNPDLKPSEIYRILRPCRAEAVAALTLASGSPGLRKNTSLYLDELRYVQPCTTGDRLLELGVEPGPEVGQLLDRLLDAGLDGVVGGKEDEERLVREWMKQR